ncbi:unnamed protein product [Auanema sp. JU1783]|nr:unnamed protein product [Auanema sp. JU1783]
MTICALCNLEIVDQFILRVHPDMEFHASCLKCHECQRNLDESCTTFVRDRRTYCRDDYMRLFATKCSRCDQVFGRHEMVMRARDVVFHVNCFNCVACQRLLKTGDEFQIKGDRLYCKDDCRNLMQTSVASGISHQSSTDVMRNPVGSVASLVAPSSTSTLGATAGLGVAGGVAASAVPTSTTTTTSLDLSCRPPSGMMTSTTTPSMYADDDNWDSCTMVSLDHTNSTSPPLSVRSPKSEEMMSNGYGSYASGNNVSSGGTTTSGSSKKKKDKQTTRVRTVLNETQLSLLKKCYAHNARPDAMLKEQLVEMTGLNARVIRVWFQNKRCKDKKRQIQMRDYQANAEKERALNHVRVGGVGPMIASAPTTHIDNMGQPIDIQHFQQWPGTTAPPPNHMDANVAMDGGYPPNGIGYADLVAPPDMGYMTSGGPPPPGYHHEYSPHLHTSDLSSPSCSE